MAFFKGKLTVNYLQLTCSVHYDNELIHDASMITFRFREFSVYKTAKSFRSTVRQLLKKFPREEQYKMSAQIDRACLSIILNIAEGSAKRSDQDFARFLEIATASANEVVAGFDCALDDKYITLDEMKIIGQKAENVIRQLGGFMKTLRG